MQTYDRNTRVIVNNLKFVFSCRSYCYRWMGFWEVLIWVAEASRLGLSSSHS